MRTHLEVTQGISQSLVSDRTVLPEGFPKCVDEIVKLTRKELLRHQRHEPRKLRDFARSSEADDKNIIDTAPGTVRSSQSKTIPNAFSHIAFDYRQRKGGRYLLQEIPNRASSCTLGLGHWHCQLLPG